MTEVTFADMLACVDREARFREKVYPRWIEQKKLLPETADLERRRLAAVRARLIWSQVFVSGIPLERIASAFPAPEWLA